MEARPHPVVERIIGWLLPPACSEHVLGDLHERHVSGSGYLRDAVRAVPGAVWGQVRRTTSRSLAIAEAGVSFYSFSLASRIFDPVEITGAGRSAIVPAGILALAMLVAIALRDAWVGRGPRANVRIALDTISGVVGALLAQAGLLTVGSRWALPVDVLIGGVTISLAFLSIVRVAFSAGDRRAAAVGGGGRGDQATSTWDPLPRILRELRWVIVAVLVVMIWGSTFVHAGARMQPLHLVALFMFVLALGVLGRKG